MGEIGNVTGEVGGVKVIDWVAWFTVNVAVAVAVT
jgi:hypothetical protein